MVSYFSNTHTYQEDIALDSHSISDKHNLGPVSANPPDTYNDTIYHMSDHLSPTSLEHFWFLFRCLTG